MHLTFDRRNDQFFFSFLFFISRRAFFSAYNLICCEYYRGTKKKFEKTFECVIALFLLLNNLIFKWCNWHGRYTVVYLLRFISGIYVCCSIRFLFNFCCILQCWISLFLFFLLHFSICFSFVWTLFNRLLYYLAIEQRQQYTRVLFNAFKYFDSIFSSFKCQPHK